MARPRIFANRKSKFPEKLKISAEKAREKYTKTHKYVPTAQYLDFSEIRKAFIEGLKSQGASGKAAKEIFLLNLPKLQEDFHAQHKCLGDYTTLAQRIFAGVKSEGRNKKPLKKIKAVTTLKEFNPNYLDYYTWPQHQKKSK